MRSHAFGLVDATSLYRDQMPAMWADPEWLAYTVESGKLGALEAQENRLMTPVDFFKPKL